MSEASFASGPYLERLLAREDLEPAAAREVMEAVVSGRVGAAALGALLAALRAKGESEAELAAFAEVLRARAIRLAAPPGTLDTCGTGGDGSATFNISTATALVAAGMGIPVAKHGNRSVSSRSGSADVLAVLGVNVEAPPDVVARCLKEAGIGFLFAPALHPGMRHAAAARRELGVRTVFNLLGPLANPAGATRQLLGVYDARWCVPLARVLHRLGSEEAWVVCGAGPGGRGWLDEVSPWGQTLVGRLQRGGVRVETFDPKSVGIAPPPPEALAADGPEASARIIRAVLDGQAGPARDVVLLNAAAAAQAAGRAASWDEGLKLAAAALDSGQARAVLERLVSVSNKP